MTPWPTWKRCWPSGFPQRADNIARALSPRASPGYGVPGDNR